MPDTVTDKYDLTKPEVEASQDTWGDKLNQDLDHIDALFFNRVVKWNVGKDAAAENPQVMGLRLNLPVQHLVPTGTAGYETLLVPESAATCRWVEYRISAMLNQWFPVGTILLWSGTIASIPAGWHLCDGTDGTPSFSSRIVLAASDHPEFGHTPGTYAGHIGVGLGRHKHSATASVDSGEAAAPDFYNDFDGAAMYDTTLGPQADLPYYACCYIMKLSNW